MVRLITPESMLISMNKKKTFYIISLIVLVLLFILGIIFFYINVIKNRPPKDKELLKRNVEADIVKSNDKVNIYLFWGDGCGNCQSLSYFFYRLPKKYKKMYNLYSFEVWNNEENVLLMTKFGKVLNVDISGVPLFIIGKDTFTGYYDNTAHNQKIKKAIVKNYEAKEKYDIYFDEIAKEE